MPITRLLNRHNWLFLAALAAFVVAAAVVSYRVARAPRPTPPTAPASPYDLGAAIPYFTVPAPGISNEAEGWKKVATVARYAWIHRYWGTDYADPGYETSVNAAKAAGLGLYLSLGPFDELKTSVSLPSGLTRPDGSPCQGDFSDPCVQKAYVDAVIGLIRTYQPAFFVAGVEVNVYQRPDYPSYVQAYKRAYDAVQRDPSIDPKPKMAPSFAYNPRDPRANGSALRQFIQDYSDADGATGASEPKLDMLAVAIYFQTWGYPTDPGAIPLDALNGILDESRTQLPLFISETGWTSKPFRTIAASERTQMDFVKHLRQMAEYTRSSGKRIELITYVTLLDAAGPCAQPKALVDALDIGWYCSLGLVNSDGSFKAAYQAMHDWHSEISEPAAGHDSRRTCCTPPIANIRAYESNFMRSRVYAEHRMLIGSSAA
jgi:hypothetical protein